MISKYFLVFTCLLTLYSCDSEYVIQDLNIIPSPNQMKMLDEEFPLAASVAIYHPIVASHEASYLREILNEYSASEYELLEWERGLPPSGNVFIDVIKGDTLSEAYALAITRDRIHLAASSRIGISRGIQTIRQILDQQESPDVLQGLPGLLIEDHPKFPHRGLLLDCCRHFMDKEFVMRYIDLLAYYKMNILHWHLTEDQGWRLQIDKYPKLTEIGAFRSDNNGEEYGGFYSKEDVKEIVKYASARHITIIPEIELPGHSSAAIASYPHLSCTGKQIAVETEWGVFKDIYCAGNDSVFTFLEDVLDEVIELFPGKYIHIGGDEAPKLRWESCEKCQKRIQDEGLEDEHALQSYFISRIGDYLDSNGKVLIGWDEILEGGIPKGATVQSWRGFEGGIEAALKGHDVIMSPTSHAYFDYDLKSINLEKVYSFNPIPDRLEEPFHKYVIGGECNMWTERAPQELVDSKVFPRMLGMAEVLWTAPDIRNYSEFLQKVRSHYSILDAKGVDYGAESVPVNPRTEIVGDSLFLVLEPGTEDLKISYSQNMGPLKSYSQPIPVLIDSKFTLLASLDGRNYGDSSEFNIVMHEGIGGLSRLDYTYSSQYTGGGAQALLNGARGSMDFRDGNWQGVQLNDIVFTAELKKSKSIEEVSSSFYFFENAWIFLPSEIEFFLSNDGESWELLGIKEPLKARSEISEFNDERGISEVRLEVGKKGKYVKMIARNVGYCPEWHDAAGSEAWLFCDELIIR